MDMLQLHELLSIGDGKNETLPTEDPRRETWLRAAEELWPTLGLGAWTAFPRRVDNLTRCSKGGELLVHVTADWPDCFLILVVAPGSLAPHAHILFDIGAEYSEILFICPALGLESPADEKMIRRYLPELAEHDDPFAILEKWDGTYMQAYARGSVFDVEHQLVSTASHYELTAPIGADGAVELFIDYAFGKYDWARDYGWKRMKL